MCYLSYRLIMPKITNNSIIRQRRQENLKPTPTALGIRMLSRRLLCGEYERPPPQVPITPLSLVENPVTYAPVELPFPSWTLIGMSNFADLDPLSSRGKPVITKTSVPTMLPVPTTPLDPVEIPPLSVDPITYAPVELPFPFWTSIGTSNFTDLDPSSSQGKPANRQFVVAFAEKPTPAADKNWRTPLRSPRYVPIAKMLANPEKLSLDPTEELKAFIRLQFYFTRMMIHLPTAMEIFSPFENGFKRDEETRSAFMKVIKPVMLDLRHCISILHDIDTDHLEAAAVKGENNQASPS